MERFEESILSSFFRFQKFEKKYLKNLIEGITLYKGSVFISVCIQAFLVKVNYKGK